MVGRVEVPWGPGRLQVRLPDQWTVLGELRPRESEPCTRVAAACAEALAEPIGASRLNSRQLAGKKVVLAVDDHSRPTPVREFIGPVLEELAAAGVLDADIDILIATGVHRASRPEEVERKIGTDVMARLRWQCHTAYDNSAVVDMGMTSRGTRVFLNKLLPTADLIVTLGALEPHLLLGFGGGLKMIMPGCAGAETVSRNHMQGVDPDNFDYVGVHGEESPMRLDLEEGARLLNREIFVVNVAVDGQARPLRFFCGDPIQAHRAGEAFVEDLARIEVPEQADVVLTNSFPMDADLRQSIKCVGNCLYASKPRGLMLGCVRCEHGLGEMPIGKKSLPYWLLRGVLKVIGKDRVLPLVEKAKKGEPVEEVFVAHFALQMLRRNHLAIFSDSEALPTDIGKKMGLARSYTDVQDMIAWAASKAPRNATVWVFPFGGATYATFGAQAAAPGS
jgi:lactate racemase